jgi:hypothetical protein
MNLDRLKRKVNLAFLATRDESKLRIYESFAVLSVNLVMNLMSIAESRISYYES